MFGVVEWICITYSDKSAKIPEVMSLINSKWMNFGFPVFRNYFIVWSVLCLLITILVIYDNNIPDPHPQKSAQWLVTILFPITLVLIVGIALIELPGMLWYGLEYWGLLGKRIRGAAKLNKILTTMTIVLYIILCFYKLYEYQENLVQSSSYNDDLIANTTIRTSTVRVLRNAGSAGGGISSSNSTDYNPLATSQYYLPIKRCEVFLVIVVWINMYYFFMGIDKTGMYILIVCIKYIIFRINICFFFSLL